MTATRTAAFSDRQRYSDPARNVLAVLDQRIGAVIRDVEMLPAWRAIFSESADNSVVLGVFRQIMLSVTQYQADTTEASMHWLGRLPKHEHRLMQSLVNHKAEEAEHGIWAARDFLALGGTAEELASQRPPTTYSVAAMWWRMAHIEDPFGYLGAEYLFENLTARLCEPLLPAMKRRALPLDGLGFIVEHATEDIKHTNLITHHLLDVATRYPDSAAAMLRCFDLFRHVYPIPVWTYATAAIAG